MGPDSQSTKGDDGEPGERKELQIQAEPSGYRWGVDERLGDFICPIGVTWLSLSQPRWLWRMSYTDCPGLGFVPYQENRG